MKPLRANAETMGQHTLDGDDITALRETYDRLVHDRLPAAARAAGDWPIREDHCFARVVLDAVFEDAWDAHVDGRPAYEHLSATQLRDAIAIARRLLEAGRPLVAARNRDSLRWRDER